MKAPSIITDDALELSQLMDTGTCGLDTRDTTREHDLENTDAARTHRAVVSLLLEPLLEPFNGALEATFSHVVAREIAADLEFGVWVRYATVRRWFLVE